MPELPEVEPLVLVFHYMLWGVVRFHRDAPAPEVRTSVLVEFAGGTVRGGRFHGRPTFFCPRCKQ